MGELDALGWESHSAELGDGMREGGTRDGRDEIGLYCREPLTLDDCLTVHAAASARLWALADVVHAQSGPESLPRLSR